MKYKKLPHLSIINHYQFITFRTKDSIDDYIKKIYSSLKSIKIREQKIDTYLDNSKKGAYFYTDTIEIMKNYLLSKDRDIYDLISFTIMPNHIHLLFKEKIELFQTLKIIKGGSAFLINKHLKREGSLWSKYYYDKLIRDNQHFDTVYKYIKNNAIKTELKDAKSRYYGIYD